MAMAMAMASASASSSSSSSAARCLFLPPAASSSLRLPSPPPPASKRSSRLLKQLLQSRVPPTAPALRRTLLRFSSPTLACTLRHLLRLQEWKIALPMYLALSESPRFEDVSNRIDLLAELAALLSAHREAERARALLEARREKLKLDPERLRELESSLILHYARHRLAGETLAAFRRSSAIAPDPRSSFSALIQAYASMDRPRDAYAALVEMRISHGLSPSLKDFKAVVFAFGRCGMFEEMESLASEMEEMGSLKDPVVFNMIISAYGAAENHAKIEEWIDKMLGAGARPSVRSLNAIAKACPSLSKLPTCITAASLFEHLATDRASRGEIGSVECLVRLWQQIEGSLEWGSVWQLDLHGTAPASARVMLSCWLEEVSRRFEAQLEFPREVCIVTGWGKHSESGGRRRRSSPIKVMVRDLLEAAGSPFMVDSQNRGRLLAKPHAVMAWLRRRRR